MCQLVTPVQGSNLKDIGCVKTATCFISQSKTDRWISKPRWFEITWFNWCLITVMPLWKTCRILTSFCLKGSHFCDAKYFIPVQMNVPTFFLCRHLNQCTTFSVKAYSASQIQSRNKLRCLFTMYCNYILCWCNKFHICYIYSLYLFSTGKGNVLNLNVEFEHKIWR